MSVYPVQCGAARRCGGVVFRVGVGIQGDDVFVAEVIGSVMIIVVVVAVAITAVIIVVSRFHVL